VQDGQRRGNAVPVLRLLTKKPEGRALCIALRDYAVFLPALASFLRFFSAMMLPIGLRRA
jgi:hypothetical protein